MTWAIPSGRATHASHRARILGLGLSVGIAIAGCHRLTPQEQAQQAATARAERAALDEELAFRNCIDEVVGAFSAASIEVIHECRAHAKEVAGQ
jgi:hypothetical protein